MDWITESKKIFATNKPAHFTDYLHCDECKEHDQTLLGSSIENISLNELGNPGWDPISFSNDDGKRYFMPALIRLSLETINAELYFSQLLFHLESDGPKNSLVVSCTPEQRHFIALFIAHMLDQYPEQIDKNAITEETFAVYQIWSET